MVTLIGNGFNHQYENVSTKHQKLDSVSVYPNLSVYLLQDFFFTRATRYLEVQFA